MISNADLEAAEARLTHFLAGVSPDEREAVAIDRFEKRRHLVAYLRLALDGAEGDMPLARVRWLLAGLCHALEDAS